MQTPPHAKDRRRVGLALLLAGLVLAVGGLFLPWLRIDVHCTVYCGTGTGNGSWSLVRAPATDGLFLICWPMWLVVGVFVLLTAGEAFQPVERHSAVPALLLAGALLVMQALGLVVNGYTGFSSSRPVLTYTLLPGFAVSLLGTLLVGVGGWLGSHLQRIETPREVAEIPAEP